MNNNNKLLEKLKEYEQVHSDLNQILLQLKEKYTVDLLQIQRLKKRKLVLKDKIIHIQNELEPDSIAEYEFFTNFATFGKYSVKIFNLDFISGILETLCKLSSKIFSNSS